MAEVQLAARPERPTEPAGRTTTAPLTLAQEHVLLLGQVATRAEELLSGTDRDPVWREIGGFCPGSYQFTVLQDGPTRWRMQVTRRQGG